MNCGKPARLYPPVPLSTLACSHGANVVPDALLRQSPLPSGCYSPQPACAGYLAEGPSPRYNPRQIIRRISISRKKSRDVHRADAVHYQARCHGAEPHGGDQHHHRKDRIADLALKRARWSLAEAQNFYAEHRDRPFYESLCAFMTSGPIVMRCSRGERHRGLPQGDGRHRSRGGQEGDLRKRFAKSKPRIRARLRQSASAAREIALNSRPEEIVG